MDGWVCDRARLARDARFDGRFVSGVCTTRIYCRPVCPVRPARSENVTFFPTAAAAELAGFRPCLRCRPEAAPGSPAWRGTATTVSRAMALIDRGVLDAGAIEELAAAVGVGARHLSRLFVRHVGAPPSAVARTRRLQVAKSLLDAGGTPIAHVALAAGFSSIRRFNAAFRATYGRPPSAVRRAPPVGRGYLAIRLAYRPPLRWPEVIRRLSAECVPGVEEPSIDGYLRTVALGGGGWLAVRPVEGRDELELRVSLADFSAVRAVIERVRVVFDLDADPRKIARQLADAQPLASLLRRRGVPRLPGAWDGFEVAVQRRVVTDVGPAAARGAMTRLVQAYGRPLALAPPSAPGWLFPEPHAFQRLSASTVGLSRAAARDLRRLAGATANGTIRFDPAASPVALIDQLAAAGIDAAGARWIAMRTLADPDAALLPDRTRGAARQSARWRPWRAYAALLLLDGSCSRPPSRAAAAPPRAAPSGSSRRRAR